MVCQNRVPQEGKLIEVGTIFEKRLIEAYISENGKDPVTNEDLTTEDLIDLKSARIVRPRPPTLTSIPSLLSVFQNEWDALVQETSTLRQHLTQARQELATALYQQDAATRVMARLSRERDEAREALSKITVNGGPATDGDAMQVDGQALSEALVATVDATQQRYAEPWSIEFNYAREARLTFPLDYQKLDGNELSRMIGTQLRAFRRLPPLRLPSPSIPASGRSR